MMLPGDCVALLVHEPSIEVFALEVTLGEIGCATLDALASAQEVKRLLSRQHPCFALLHGGMGEQVLRPVAKQLAKHSVPFALLDLGVAQDAFDRIASLRAAPRVTRFLHPSTLYATARSTVPIFAPALPRRIGRSRKASSGWRASSA
jgi:hypothetical protein